MMIANTIGYWNMVKGKLKQKYPMIADEDLHFNEGKEKEMIELLGYKLGITREELHSIISNLE